MDEIDPASHRDTANTPAGTATLRASPVETSTPPYPAFADRLYRRRFMLLALYIALLALTVMLVPTIVDADWPPHIRPLWWLDSRSNSIAFTLAAVLLVPQCLFLLGAPQFRWPRPTGRRSLRASIAGGAFMAAALSIGVISSIMAMLNVWEPFWSALHRDLPRTPDLGDVPWYALALLGGCWLIWLVIFGLMFASTWVVRFRRMYRWLVAGTVLELLITIPVDVQVRRRTSCYCGEGTFVALWAGLTAVFWVFGPGVVLLFQFRKVLRRAELRICRECGYDLRAWPQRCPECGTPAARFS
jgi:hypothetical protein